MKQTDAKDEYEGAKHIKYLTTEAKENERDIRAHGLDVHLWHVQQACGHCKHFVIYIWQFYSVVTLNRFVCKLLALGVREHDFFWIKAAHFVIKTVTILQECTLCTVTSPNLERLKQYS